MTTSAPPAVRSTAADLILTRLAVPSRKPPSAGDIRKAVGQVFGRPLAPEEFAELTEVLRAEGLVEPRPRLRGGVQLTVAGHAAALEYLGVAALPPRTNWKAVRAKFLFPKALGVAASDVTKLDNADKVAAYLIRRKYGLPTGKTVRQVLEALACKLLNRPNETSLDGLFRAVLSEELHADERLSKDDLLKQFPRASAGSKSGSLDDLRGSVVEEWLRAPSEPPANESRPDMGAANSESRDLPAFAGTVKRIARDSPPAARFGGNKVFIAAAWRESQGEDGFPRMPLDEFKTRLVDASREGLIRIEPADLVQAMDPALVADSETTRAGSTSHFILLENSHP